MKLPLALAAMLFPLAGLAFAQPAAPAPAPARAVLVELFTSEGCSSCPPADALLKQLNGMHTPDGALIVGLSEHVTYWNDLGWADPFSQPLFTRRQEAYGEHFKLDSVYTPQIVVNGETQLVGSNENGVLRAIVAARAAAFELRIASATPSGETLQVTCQLAGTVPPGTEVWAVVADDMARSGVLRGENGGHTLSHVAVARTLVRVGTASAAGTLAFSIALPAAIQGQQKTGRHLVLFAQQSGAGRVLAVETRPL